MNNAAVYALATWQVASGNLDTVMTLLPELVRKSRDEEGNLYYKIYCSQQDAHTLLLHEGYRDEVALAQHKDSDHFKKLVLEQIVPLLVKREVLLARELDMPL